MNHRERILAAIRHEPVDRLPMDIWATREVWDKLSDHLKVETRAEIYERLLQRNDLSADRCIFIDDSPKNVEGAAALRIDAIHFTTPTNLKHALVQRGYSMLQHTKTE